MKDYELKLYKIGDFFLILLLGLGTAASFFFNPSSRVGTEVLVILQNQKIGLFSTSKDTVFTLVGPVGKTEIQIQDARVWISKAPCRHHICQHQGKISKSGQILVCVPNRIYVQIEGQPDSEIDSVTM